MSAVESALEVLSRAATMVQEERPKTASLHRKPSAGWRKERRRDPIQCEALDMSATRVHHTRPSVIVPAAPKPGATTEDTAVTPTGSATPAVATRGCQRTGMRNPGVASDPAIDEHFKRSLGPKDYAAVFNAANNPADKEAGLSVDDHFAKALGETWAKLQETSKGGKGGKGSGSAAGGSKKKDSAPT